MNSPDAAPPAAIVPRDLLLSLHQAQDPVLLHQNLQAALAQALPGTRHVVLMTSPQPDLLRVEAAQHSDHAVGETVPADLALPPGDQQLPVLCDGQPIGELRFSADGTIDLEFLRELLAHYGSALLNLQINQEAVDSSDLYFASLQAFEEGVVLFQEQEREAVSARFLSLLTAVLTTHPGALYLLDQPGNVDSELILDQALGVPETMLDALRTRDGEWWPRQVLADPPAVLDRDANGLMEPLDPEVVPEPLKSLVACPLQFHGLTVGIALVFNADVWSDSFRSRIESVRRLGELGAAIFHRLRLEEVAVRSREVETQVAIASRIQARLLPTTAPSSTGIQCAWTSEPAQSVGGDYVDLGEEDGEVFAVIADVSGHGINSALLMTSFRATCRAESFRRRPADLLAKLNDEIHYETGDTGMFVTAAVFRIAPDGRRATYASAGHNDVYLWRDATGEVELLESTGPSTGFFAGMDYDEHEIELHPGDVLCMYTDGVVEATAAGASEEMFGDDRLIECLRASHAGTADDVLQTVLRELNGFTGDGEREDDVSVSVIKVLD
ncbi:MAG: PP2C family protein-serine/threonine phosphatase [Planctomycetota bacterium]